VEEGHVSFLDRARERALAAKEQVRNAAGQVASAAEGAIGEHRGPTPPTGDVPPETGTPAPSPNGWQQGVDVARHGLASLVDRLDPRLVADVVIKATSVQERANAALREKGSPYRIDGISITATIPPQVSFSIGRSGAAEEA
jgi:hypothetical protein